MRQASLDQIAPLLDVLRANPALEEVAPMMFHLDGRDFVHFHDYPDGVAADVRLARRVVRMRVASAAEQAELLEQIDECLSRLESRVRDRERRRRRRQRG
jgi:hypothetical protein